MSGLFEVATPVASLIWSHNVCRDFVVWKDALKAIDDDYRTIRYGERFRFLSATDSTLTDSEVLDDSKAIEVYSDAFSTEAYPLSPRNY